MASPWRHNPLNSPLAEGVRRVGFRKWYERELLSSHAHMLLALLSVVGLLGSLEATRGAPLAEQLLDWAFVLLCAGVGLWALRRYLFLLTRAEDLANQANCEDCGEYGRFEVVGDRRAQGETEVRCRKCAHRWTITSSDD